MSAIERKPLLPHIAALATDADAVERSSRVFLPLASHRLALRPEIVIIEGSRGAGKTALFHLVNELGERIRDFFEDRSIPSATWIDAYSEHVVHPSATVLDHFVASVSALTDTPLRAFWATHLLARLEESSVPGAVMPPTLAKVRGESPQNLTKWVPHAENHIAEVMTSLDNVDSALATKKHKLVFATYDHLDRLGLLESTRSTRQRLTRALVALWLSFSTRYKNLRGKVFLRPDLFEEAERSFADASKLRPRSVSLEWDVESLYQLLVRHLANAGPSAPAMQEWLRAAGVQLHKHATDSSFGLMPGQLGEKGQRNLAKKLAGEVMGKGPKKGYTHRWIPARLKDAGGRIVPRSFLRLIAYAAKEALRDPPGRGPLIKPPQLVQALKETSKDRVNELREEYLFVGRLANLRDKTMLMERKEVIRLLAQPAEDVDGFKEDGDSVFEELLRIGVLETRADGRIDVPDIYRYGYGIKRKGGAASPR
jgi:hypothetical protein